MQSRQSVPQLVKIQCIVKADYLCSFLFVQEPIESLKAVTLLEAFQKVPRFTMVTMSIPKAQKDSLGTLWSEAMAAQAQDAPAKATLDNLRSVYGL